MYRMSVEINSRKKKKIVEDETLSNSVRVDKEEYWENRMDILMDRFEKMSMKQKKMEEGLIEIKKERDVKEMMERMNRIMSFVEEIDRKQKMKIEDLERENEELKYQMGIMKEEEEKNNKDKDKKTEYDFYN